MMSPGLIPALSAGLFGSTALTSAPCAFFSPKESARSWLTPWMVTPSRPRLTLPYFCRSSLTFIATSMGTANDSPM